MQCGVADWYSIYHIFPNDHGYRCSHLALSCADSRDLVVSPTRFLLCRWVSGWVGGVGSLGWVWWGVAGCGWRGVGLVLSVCGGGGGGGVGGGGGGGWGSGARAGVIDRRETGGGGGGGLGGGETDQKKMGGGGRGGGGGGWGGGGRWWG